MTTPIMNYYNNSERTGNTLSPVRPENVPLDKQVNEMYKNVLEHISESGVELTVTFKPELQNRFRPQTLTNMVRDILLKYKHQYPKTRVFLIGEYSLTGIYHMHGSIHADGKCINSLRRKLPREIGRTEIKPIKYVESWVKYCFKIEDSLDEKTIDDSEIIHL